MSKSDPYAAPDVYDVPAKAVASQEPVEVTTTSEETPDNPPQLQVPEGSIRELLEWVGDDTTKAESALEAEHKREKPRKSLIADLEEKLGR
jgi:hypothetical protein